MLEQINRELKESRRGGEGRGQEWKGGKGWGRGGGGERRGEWQRGRKGGEGKTMKSRYLLFSLQLSMKRFSKMAAAQA